MKLNGSELSPEENERVTEYLHTLSDFERISDHAMNIRQVAQEKFEKKITFSESGDHEIDVLTSAVNEILELAFSAFIEENLNKAYKVEPLEEHIDVLCDELKLRHIDRLQKGVCSLQIGFVFNDLITNLERISDHCSNIAIAMSELERNEFDTHDYQESLLARKDEEFSRYYKKFSEKYQLE
jgi:phosphate:Na+ symporter